MNRDPVFEEIEGLLTEQQNPRTVSIDRIPLGEILKLINEEDRRVIAAVGKEIPYIEEAVELYVDTINRGGRIFYIGAGTSGRIGVQDSAELPPTFGTPFWQVQGLIAGGYGALIRACEGAEDKREEGEKDLRERGLTEKDFVIGIAASKRTPYVLGGILYARSICAKTALITSIPREEVDIEVDVLICPVVGPEVIMGSTRMKAGTAEKLVLNMISTSAMILTGRVYKNVMVELMATSKKLEERAKRTVMMVTGVDYRRAEEILKEAGGSVKTAIVMILRNLTREEAESKLREEKRLWKIIERD